MDRLKDALYYLEGPQNVADFQKFCGLETYVCKAGNGSVLSAELDCNGVKLPENGDAGEPNHTNDLRHRGVKNGYCEQVVDNGINLKQSGVIPNGLCSPTKNGFSKNGHVNGFPTHDESKHDSNGEVYCKINNKAAYYLFCLGSALGNEHFYLLVFPFFTWNVDSRLLRQMMIIWHVGMYLGQAAKDVFRRPRPASPPVAYLEKRYVTEYGMPSTHSTVGAIIPFSLLILSMNEYQYPFGLGLVVSLLWTTLVGCSRIYLGMHTALDVICGILTACVIMPVLLPLVVYLDHQQITHPLAPLVTVLGSFILCFIYPPVKQWNTARGDTATVHGIGGGISFGCWLNYNLGWMHAVPSAAPYPIQMPTVEWFALSVLRYAIGAIIISGGRIVAKKISLRGLSGLFGQDHRDINVQRQMKVETPQKFITYFSISVCASFIIPTLFSYLGIVREAFYTEF